jgi:hypothetical protein
VDFVYLWAVWLCFHIAVQPCLKPTRCALAGGRYHLRARTHEDSQKGNKDCQGAFFFPFCESALTELEPAAPGWFKAAAMSDDDERDYLWKHFAFNAEQRLKAFRFFVIFSGFANGGILTAFNGNSHSAVFLFLGLFVCVLSMVFYLIDRRSRKLLEMTKPGLIKCEEGLSAEAQVFTLDRNRSKWATYTFAFHVLFACQLVFGFVVIAYGLFRLF